MFAQGSKPPDSPAEGARATAGRASGEPSVISTDLKIVGDLHCSGDIQIKGTVEGDIRSRAVTVGEGAHVEGAIYGDTVHVSGSVKGQIESPTVTIARSARIEGDIVHESLAVEAGAHLEGQCKRLDAKKAAEGVTGLKGSATGASGTGASAASGTGTGAETGGEAGKRAAGGSAT